MAIDKQVPVVAYEDLKRFVHGVLKAAGVDDFSADAVTESLVETSARGTDSHGVRLLNHYMITVEDGGTTRCPNITHTAKFPCFLTVDADSGFGQAAGVRAVDVAMEAAEKYGMAVATVINSNHPGAMWQYTVRAAKKGYIAFGFTNTGPKILSHGGRDAYFGTNPVCFAAPRVEEDPVCLDMATTIIPWNRVMHCKRTLEPLVPNVASDEHGEMTTDPIEATHLLPIGTYKGFGLAAMVEILSTVLSGMPFGPHGIPMYGPGSSTSARRRLGQTYIVMRSDGCVAATEFAASLQQLSDEIRALQPAASNPTGRVMMPGDPEIHEAVRRKKFGVPLDDVIWSDFERMSSKYGVPMPALVSEHATA